MRMLDRAMMEQELLLPAHVVDGVVNRWCKHDFCADQ